MSASDGKQSGAALVAVVLITLALFAVGHGLLALSLGELAAARAAVKLLEASTAAESSVHLALAGPGPAWLDSVAIGGQRADSGRTFGRALGSTTAWRLASESWWLEGTGRVGAAESRIVRLAWAMDPLTRVKATRGAISIAVDGPVVIAGSVDATTPLAVDPPLGPADCDPWIGELGARYALDPLVPVAISADTLPFLGMLDFDDLLEAGEVVVSGTVVPTPAEASGACLVEEPSNWGDPERPWRACGNHFALRKAVGSLRVEGGTGQGVLIVDGDVTFDGGARFHGLVLASGALHVEAGSQLVGMATATGGAYVAAGGLVRASACWVARSLAANRSTLGRLRAVPGQGLWGPV